MNINKVVLLVALFLFGSVFGFLLGASEGMKEAEQTRETSAVEIDKLNRALDFFLPQVPDEIFSVSGSVISVSESGITVQSPSFRERPLPNVSPIMEIRKIDIGSDTKLSRINPAIDAGELPKLGEAFQPPPETEITLQDIKAGDTVTAHATENIKSKLDFTATKIQLIER